MHFLDKAEIDNIRESVAEARSQLQLCYKMHERNSEMTMIAMQLLKQVREECKKLRMNCTEDEEDVMEDEQPRESILLNGMSAEQTLEQPWMVIECENLKSCVLSYEADVELQALKKEKAELEKSICDNHRTRGKQKHLKGLEKKIDDLTKQLDGSKVIEDEKGLDEKHCRNIDWTIIGCMMRSKRNPEALRYMWEEELRPTLKSGTSNETG